MAEPPERDMAAMTLVTAMTLTAATSHGRNGLDGCNG